MISKALALLFIFCILTFQVKGLGNPGVLITVPFPLKPPQAIINLPISIQPILINALELSNIQLKSLTYEWQFTENQVDVKIKDARITFSWAYKADQGQGIFTQTLYQLIFGYQIIKNAHDRIDLNITSTKSKLGHSQVHLGGNVKQTVVIQVTNLIMNHAAVTFRKVIENAIKKAVQSVSSLLDSDIKTICSPKCVYIDTTLVAPPIVNNKFLVIQISGAPYIQGEKSSQLNPETALIKTDSQKIQLQIHKKLFTTTLTKILEVQPKTFEFWVGRISTVVEINSLTLTNAFPNMKKYASTREVMFSANTPKIDLILSQSDQLISINGNIDLNVYTQIPQTKTLEKYLPHPVNVKFTADLSIIHGWKSSSVRVKKVSIIELNCNQQDINNGFIVPSQVNDAKAALMTFLANGVNGSLNEKLITLDFSGILATLKGNIFTDRYQVDLTLSQSPLAIATTSSKVKVVLDA